MSKIVELKCLKHKYPDRTEVSACGLDFVVEEGEKVGLVGGNGSGKTTLIMHLVGMLSPTEGKVSVLGVDPYENFSEIGDSVGVVVQQVEDQLVGPTVEEDIKFSLVNYGFDQKEIEKRTKEVMSRLGIEDLKGKVIHYLSGGQKKKVALAGALVLKPKLLVLDEAFNQIDPDGLSKVIGLIDDYCQNEDMAVVMAVSNKEDIKHFNTIYLLEDGKITFKGTEEELEERGGSQFCSH